MKKHVIEELLESHDYEKLFQHLEDNPAHAKKLDKNTLSKIHYCDVLKNGAAISPSRKEIYKNVLTDGEIFSNALNAYDEKGNFLKIISEHKTPTDTEEKEKILLDFLKRKNFKITNQNSPALWHSPVVLEYFLSDENLSNQEKINFLLNKDKVKAKELLSKVPEPVSENLLSKISSSFKNLFTQEPLDTSDSINNAFLHKHYNPYIALSGLQSGDLPTKTFQEECLKINNSIHISTYPLAIKLLQERNADLYEFYKTVVRRLILFPNVSKYTFQTKEELDNLSKCVNLLSLSPLLLDPKKLPDFNEVLDKLDLPNNFNSPDIEKLNFDEINIEQLLNDLHVENKPASLEDAIKNIKNKKIAQLSNAEANLLIAYAKKKLSQNDINDYSVSFSLEKLKKFDGDTLGQQNSTSRTITFTITYASVEEFFNTLNHEVNHAIQCEWIKTMNIEKDPDLIDYSKDMIIYNIDSQYYKHNYQNISFELDADLKARIETKCFFNTLNETFDEALEEYQKTQAYRKTSNRNDIINDVSLHDVPIDQIFAMKLEHLFKTDKIKYHEAVLDIQAETPILAIEYNLNTAQPRSIKELIQLAQSCDVQNPKDAKTLDIIKHIIKYRCNPEKVGETQAQENLKSLQMEKTAANLNIDIQKQKNTFIKYSEIFLELKNSLINKTTNSIRK